ncbi:LysR family transcriptional regulator [Ruegeria sp. R13_0]|uniref:LysR family transcriptional regulator n=1 Tax=Ruegeria sp. R13_0 TaxID=2821099 RepID=UPI001ADA0515|nr:LysR family transcriptional regulator [Ruegeria sp. R13_0]MBO9436390.1 LysR family transcriptional regulator [Ruegeria sp. R13_0]
MKLNWDDLRVLLALVRSGSLTRASTSLGIDQSTVGRRLSALEAALGTTLFLRSKTGIIPTEAGERLIADAMEIERRASRIEELAASPSGQPTGELRIAGEHWLLARVADRLLPRLLAEHSHLSVRLNAGVPATSAWTPASVSLWFEDTPQMGEFSIKLCDVPFAVYAHSDLDPNKLGWIALADDTAHRRAPAKFMDKHKTTDAAVHFSGNDPMLAHNAVRNGVGKGLLPVCLGEEDPALARVGGNAMELDRTLHLHVHPDTVQTLKVQVAIRLLRENARQIFGRQRKEYQNHCDPRLPNSVLSKGLNRTIAGTLAHKSA